MTGIACRTRGWLPVLLVLAVVLAAQIVPAQEEDEDFEAEPEAAAALAPNPNTFVLSEQQFNSWVFNDYGTTIDQVRAKMRSLMDVQIAEMQRVCDLTEAQKAKLRLAGRGDTKRFFDRVDEKRRKFQGKTYDHNQVNEIFQEIRPLQESFNAGLFDGEALFARITTRVLDAQQQAQYEEILRERRKSQYANLVDLSVIKMSRVVGLSAAQEKQLGEVILRETRTPRRLGTNLHYVVFVQMARIPEEKLRPIFDEAQWPLMQQYLQRGQGMLPFLKQNGYLPAEEDEDSAPEPRAEATKADVNR